MGAKQLTIFDDARLRNNYRAKGIKGMESNLRNLDSFSLFSTERTFNAAEYTGIHKVIYRSDTEIDKDEIELSGGIIDKIDKQEEDWETSTYIIFHGKTKSDFINACINPKTDVMWRYEDIEKLDTMKYKVGDKIKEYKIASICVFGDIGYLLEYGDKYYFLNEDRIEELNEAIGNVEDLSIEEIARKQLHEVDSILEKEYNLEKIINTENKKRKEIDDYGEEIYGARKDYFKNFAKEYSAITKQSLIELPLGKAFKLPPLNKMVAEGVLDEDEATFIFAVYCTVKKKPQGKSYTQKRLLNEWASDTFEKALIIKSLMIDDKAERERLIEGYKKPDPAKQAALNLYVAKLKEWNPNSKYDYQEKEVANSYAVIYDVLKKYEYTPGQKINVPFHEIVTTTDGLYCAMGDEFKSDYRNSSYNSIAEGKTIGELEDLMLILLSIANPDESMQIPINLFTVRGNERVFKELDTFTGALYKGGYRDWQWLTEQFVHVTEAFMEDKKAEFLKLHPKMKDVKIYTKKEQEFVGFKSYLIRLVILGKHYEKVIDVSTEDEARAYIENNYDEVNKYFVDKLLESRTKKKREAEDSFFVSRKWNRDKKDFEYGAYLRVGKENNLIATFDTLKEADEFIKENASAIVAKMKELDENLSKAYFATSGRKNKDWRKGADVNEKMFCDEFGFRGIQFGNWTNLDDRQVALNECYDALCDLAAIINWPRKAISLNGELGLAFGARGTGWANAHYEPLQVVINLTKTRGAGCLGHEWWHALDNYFERLNGNPGLLLTEVVNPNSTAPIGTLRPVIVDDYRNIVKAVEKSDYSHRSNLRGAGYWGRMCEMTARMFQVYLWDKMRQKDETSPFLERGGYAELEEEWYKVNYEFFKIISDKFDLTFEEYRNLDPSKMINPYVYPTEKEIKQFEPLIDQLFKDIKIEDKNGKMFLSGFPENALDVTEETKKDDVISAIANIQNYKRGQYYLNIDQPTEQVANALCRMMYMRAANSGQYEIKGENVNVSIDCKDKKKSEITITIERESGKKEFKYKFPDSGNTQSIVVNAIINGFLSLFETGEYIDNSGLYTK